MRWAVALLAAAAAAGRAGHARADSAAAPDPALGRAVYRAACAACHGAAGDGRGPAARRLDPRPRDFTRGVFKFRSTRSGSPPTDEDLVRTVTRGVPGTSMPAWEGLLSPEARRAVVAWLRSSFTAGASDPGAPAGVVPIGVPPPSTPGSIRRGRAVYLTLGCWNCHGPHGEGDGPAAPTLLDETGRNLRATDFSAGVFKSGPEPGDLYRTLVAGLDGAAMPSYLDSTVVTREAAQALAPLAPHLDAGELAEVRRFLSSQLDAGAFYALPEAEQRRRAEAWRWDLVHYLRSLPRRPWWRRVLGIGQRQ